MPEETEKSQVQGDYAETEEKITQKEDSINAMAIFSYLGLLFLIPLLAAKDDEFAQYHAKQGMVLCIAGIIGYFVSAIPVIGWILAPFVTLIWLIFSILGIVNIVKGKKKELPIIGKYADKFHI